MEAVRFLNDKNVESRGIAASVIAEAKTWKKCGELIKTTDFWFASTLFRQSVRGAGVSQQGRRIANLDRGYYSMVWKECLSNFCTLQASSVGLLYSLPKLLFFAESYR